MTTTPNDRDPLSAPDTAPTPPPSDPVGEAITETPVEVGGPGGGSDGAAPPNRTSATHLGQGPVGSDEVTAARATATVTALLEAPVEPGEDVAVTGKASLIIRRLLRNKGAVLGLVMLTLVVLFAVVGNVPNKWAYDDQDLMNIGAAPGVGEHWLGTNAGGIDLYALIVRGAGKSLLIAFFVGVGAPILGAIYGTTIAFWGGRRERVGMWILDMLILMPYFLLIAVFMGASGGSALTLAFLLTLFGWMSLARVIRAMTQSLREREFVQSARYMGVSDVDIVRRHIIPNIGSYLILNIVIGTFSAIITETALSYLGIGVRPPDTSLGMLIGQSSSQLYAYPWMFWAPTITLLWITLSLSLIGDGLRDALDPNSKSGARA